MARIKHGKMKPNADQPSQDIGFYAKSEQDALTVIKIHSLLEKLPQRDRWCVEFGAADGIDSTSRDLILNHGYSAVLVEGSGERFDKLKQNYADWPNVTTIHRFIGFNVDDGLDSDTRKNFNRQELRFCHHRH